MNKRWFIAIIVIILAIIAFKYFGASFIHSQSNTNFINITVRK